MLMRRKAQVTVIIIMVLIIGMITGVFYYLKTARFEKTVESEERQQQLGAARVQPVRDFAESCISLSVKDALELLGKQGGYTYRSQGGMIDDPPSSELNRLYANFEDKKVRYAIFAPKSDVGTIFFAIPPLYPWPEFPWDYPDHPERMQLTGYFGANQLKPLLKPLPESIQEQLEYYIKNKTLECLDWSAFEMQGLSFKEGEMNVSLTIADNDLTFKVDYPILITDTATGGTSSLDQFVVTHPIRLKKIYDFIRFVIDHDVMDINFSISRHVSDGVSANIQPDYVMNDDLIIIKDDKSKLLGKVYEFRFMRHNRAPALFYISDAAIEGKVVNNGANITFDPDTRLLSVNNPSGSYEPDASDDFTIQLDALDPDEDNLTFSFIPPLPFNVPDLFLTELPFTIKVDDIEITDRQDIIFEAETIHPAEAE